MTYQKIPCCIECDPQYLSKARYGIATLLRPIRLEPEWVPKEGLRAGGIYYGADFEGVDPGILRIPLHPSTQAYFDARIPMTHNPSGLDGAGLLRLFPVEPAASGEEEPHALSWDPIASAFYFLSGWQEWVDNARDVHGRFPFHRSIQARFDLAYVPMVDRYRRYIRRELETLGLTIRRRLWNGRETAVCITHDVDYHRKWRPGILLGETVENVVRGRPSGRLRGAFRLTRSVAASALKGDPFRRSLNAMVAAETVAGFGATWFFKAGAHGRYDVDYPLESGWIKRIIDHLELGGFEIGLHPSYFASDHEAYLDAEQQRLQRAVTSAVQSVRSHYLRWFVDQTPRMYADAGFFIDSTLGFAEHEGFRNGTTVPFRIFDIVANQQLDIWEMPVAVMDTTLFGYRDMDLQSGIDATRRLLDAAREFGGVLVILWHNIMLDDLGNNRIAPHFESVLADLDPKTIYVASLRDALSVWLDQTAATTPGDE